MLKRSALIGVSILVWAAVASATPIVIGGTQYVRAGNSEAGIVASFGPAPTAVSTPTSLTYSGFVEVVVTGTGFSAGSCLNDAFYVYSGCGGVPSNNGLYYQLALDTAAITGAPGTPTPVAQLATQSLVFDVDAGVETVAPYLPVYRPDHTYNFVVDLSLTGGFAGGSSLLHFGVANGIYADNGGFYTLDVHQLQPVPEPASLALLGLGLLGAAATRRRHR